LLYFFILLLSFILLFHVLHNIVTLFYFIIESMVTPHRMHQYVL